MLAMAATLQTTDALIVTPLKSIAPVRTHAPVMQFDFFKKKEPEPEPEPAKPAKRAPVSSGGGGLFGAFQNKQPRRSDGGGLTSSFKRQAPTPTKGKKGKASVQPEKWIEGRSGPQVNPAWTAWSKNQ